MRTLREWFWRMVSQFRRRELDRQSVAEMRFHLDTEIEAGIRRGLSREQAEHQAHLRAGHIAAALEDVRDERSLGWLDGTWMDLRHAWSGLRRRPAFLFAAGGALTAAVAINTLIFTVVNGVLLRPLPYPAPERLDYRRRTPRRISARRGRLSFPAARRHRCFVGANRPGSA